MASSDKAHVNPTLLLADDSVTIQKVIELTFADQGVQVVAVGDGDAAIKFVEQSPPDIVLADVGMPGKSGYEVSRHIKRSPRLAHIPVLLLTGAFEPLDQSRAREAGCDGVLAKPFEPQAVINRVRELLGHPPDESAAAEPALSRRAAQLDTVRTPAPIKLPVAHAEEVPKVAMTTKPGPADAAAPDNRPAPAPIASPAVPEPPPAAVKAGLADAFAALLAAEQRGTAVTDRPAWLAAPAASDELVESVVQRVLDRLSRDVVRETVAEAVSGIAERLVVEEIERIKASIK